MRHAFVAFAVIGLASALACGRGDDSQPTTVDDLLAREYNYPAEWTATNNEAARLFAEGRKVESTALLQKVVDAHPQFSEAHFSLAGNYEFMANDLKGDPAQAEVRKQHLHRAATHYQRFRELMQEPEDRAMATSLLVQIYGREGLNDIGQARTFARHYIDERPTRAEGYALLAEMMRLQGEHDAASDMLANAALVVSADERDGALAEAFVTHVEQSPNLPRATVQRLIDDALKSAERRLSSESTRVLGMIEKGKALVVQANRLETDAARRRRLAAEGDRLYREGVDLLSRSLSK